MGFTNNPEHCLGEVAGNLRTKVCSIFYKKCQEVDIVSSLLHIEVPKTIEEEVSKSTLHKELMKIKQTLLANDKQTKNWIRYTVVRVHPMGMPWEGIQEKK